MKKKILSMLLVLTMVVTLLPAVSITASATGGTYGQTTTYAIPTASAASYASDATSGADYVVSGNNITINTAKGMAWLTQNSIYWSSVYTITLANDIVCSAFVWSPIGTNASKFYGNFDGNSKTVSGIYINSSSNYQGLFGYVGSGVSISNVCVDNSYIKGLNYVGGIAGMVYSNSMVTNCHSSATVIGTSEVGGVIGECVFSMVSGGSNAGSVSASSNYAGGITGISSGIVVNCYNTGTVDGGSFIGGVVGQSSRTVANCYNTGNVNATTNFAGGIVGFNNGGIDCFLYNCYNTGSVSGGGINVGGVIGLNQGDNTTADCYWLSGSAPLGAGTMTNVYAFSGSDTSWALANSSAFSIGTTTVATGGSLLTALNAWVNTENSGTYKTWRAASSSSENGGYPVLDAAYVLKTAVSIAQTAQTVAYTGAVKAFEISGTPNTGFSITYNQGAGNVSPTNVGTYNVVITRAEDSTYASYSKTISGGLVISNASQSAPAVSKTDETFTGLNDGTITGVDSTMEYKLPGAGSYTAITGTTVTGLIPGTYLVRYKATINYNAGTDAIVTIVSGSTNTYTMSASTLTVFTSQTVGYLTVPAAQTVTITNTGNQAITLTQPTSTNYTIGTLSTTNLIAGGTASFTVQPKTGLSVGIYNETIHIAGTYSAAASVSPQFIVSEVISDGGTPTTPSNSADIIIGGKSQTAGTVSFDTNTSGQTVRTITIDTAKFDAILAALGDKPTIIIPSTTDSAVVNGVLTGQMVKDMETKDATLEITTNTATYVLPVSEIDISAVSEQFGTQVALKDIKVSVSIAEPSADTAKIVEDTASKNSYQIVVKPVEFTITCTSGDKTVDVSKFNGYVERTVAIPDGIDPSKITTGVVLNADGTFSHVPTRIIMIGGKYFAKINSLTNSTYSVIYNPVTFADVTNHWAKDAINDMGSRMVVTGAVSSNYDPDRSITRAEFAAIVVRALGLQEGKTESSFGDVTMTDWFNGYVDTATAYSLITGYDSTSYAPNDQITREQAMAIIARAMKLTGLSVSLTDSEVSALLAMYTDSTAVSSYAKEDVAECLKMGVVTGTTASTISPKSYVTRAEVAVMVQRLLLKSGLI